jgi:signal transduction histidine kinase
MRDSIRQQVLVPMVAIQAVAILAITIASVALASRRTERQIVDRLDGVVDALEGSNFPLTEGVLARMRELSGAQFVAYGEDGIAVAASDPRLVGDVLQLAAIPPRIAERPGSLSDATRLEAGGKKYLAVRVGPRPRPSRSWPALLVLYPESSWREARWESARAPLVLGAGALALSAAATSWIAHRISGRIRRLEHQVARIAGGDFRPLDLGTTRDGDELSDLGRSINRMCEDLRRMRRTIGQAERTNLLAQLAAGLAHQLRNALTGARMSIQLHVKRCDAARSDPSMDVALRQLSLMEEQVRGLLTLGGVEERPHGPCDLARLVDDVALLVEPACRHSRVELAIGRGGQDGVVAADEPSLRAAVLNLVLNAIEAAGPGGSVAIDLHRDGSAATLEVGDTGPGPPAALAEGLFEPFVTGKPEGVGLGLALARHVALAHHGELSWVRDGEWTRFRLRLPVASANQ